MLNTVLATEWQYWFVGLSISEISQQLACIAMKFSSNIHVPRGINPLTFHQVQTQVCKLLFLSLLFYKELPV